MVSRDLERLCLKEKLNCHSTSLAPFTQPVQGWNIFCLQIQNRVSHNPNPNPLFASEPEEMVVTAGNDRCVKGTAGIAEQECEVFDILLSDTRTNSNVYGA